MIFISKNEDGIPAYELIMRGEKTVTRRKKPQPVGAIRAVQPGRGKRAICYIKITSCKEDSMLTNEAMYQSWELDSEAKKEGFNDWNGLVGWFCRHGGIPQPCYRIEFIVCRKTPILFHDGKN